MPKKRPIVKIKVADEESGILTAVELSASEFNFINAYFDENMNATRSYMRCYPNSSRNAAASSSVDLLNKPNVKAAIRQRLNDQAMGQSEILARLASMARASHEPFIKIADDGFIYFDFSHPEAKNNLHLIKKIKTKRERRIDGDGQQWEGEWVEVELHDSAAALRDLGRYHKMFVDRTETTETNINIDWDELTPDQIVRIRNGEDVARIKQEVDAKQNNKREK